MKVQNKKAFSVIEYAVLIVIILSAFVIMRNYIQRGFFGAWGQAGQGFAFGRQYDTAKTVECRFDDQLNVWYDHNCFVNQRQSCAIGDNACEESIIGSHVCSSSSCSQPTQ